MANISATREADLSKKEICRFCLAQQGKLGSIYVDNARIKSTASLPLQIMAITSIEVNSEDGMPSYICLDCRLLFEHCYRFKQMCKRADVLLRQYPLTGQWPAPLEKPRAPVIAGQVVKKELTDPQPMKLLNSMAKSPNVTIENVQVMETGVARKKLLNSAAAAATTSSKPGKSKAYQEKLDNNQELSMDDVHHLIADMVGDMGDDDVTVQTYTVQSPTKPKLLNKSTMRILNKGASVPLEPRLATPQIKRDEDGNVAIVTEILDSNAIMLSEDPTKNAAPVATNVFPCPHCERSFPLLQLRDIHMVNHTRKRCFQCTECDKSFFSKYDLQKHNFVHTGERPFKCSVCDKAFTRGALLHRHERTHTDIPKFICVFCEKPFISRDEMEKHAERHTKKRPFQCGVCGKAFAFKQGLERHEVVHCNDLPFPCQYCNQSFITAGKLARHLVAHAGKRAYPCKYCPKSYLLSHHLSRHLRSHKQGAAIFICSICKDTHQTYDSLVDHSVIHASISLVCPLCNETIADFDSVEQHIQAHKENESFACEFCDLIFLNSVQLQRHIEDEHVMDMVPYQSNESELAPSTGDASARGESALLQELLGDEDEHSANDASDAPPIKMRKLGDTKKVGAIAKSKSAEHLRRKKVMPESASPDKEVQGSSSSAKRQTRSTGPIEDDGAKMAKQGDASKAQKTTLPKKEAQTIARTGRMMIKTDKVVSPAAARIAK